VQITSDINISQGSVATRLRSGGLLKEFYWRFHVECSSERLLENLSILDRVVIRSRDGNPKEPSPLEFGSVRVLPNMRICSVRVLSSYGKMKVRFWFGSLCAVFGSVRFGSIRVLIRIYLVYIFTKFT